MLAEDKHCRFVQLLCMNRQLQAVLTMNNIVLMDVRPAYKAQEGGCLGCTGGTQNVIILLWI